MMVVFCLEISLILKQHMLGPMQKGKTLRGLIGETVRPLKLNPAAVFDPENAKSDEAEVKPETDSNVETGETKDDSDKELLERVLKNEEGLDEEDDDDLDNSISLAAMEAELKPKVLQTFDDIAGNYKKLRKLQDQLS